MAIDDDRILLAHGAGGSLSHRLTEQVFLPAFDNPTLRRLEDCAVVDSLPGKMAFTTDSFVVDPLFFPGGDIGRLAVCGTVNDLAMAGATQSYLAASLIVEEGFSIGQLKRIAGSMRHAADEAGVPIVAGDTKVVEAGKAHGIYITTTGIGFIPSDIAVSASAAKPGDKIVLSGSIGDHGAAVLCHRAGFEFAAGIESDCAPLNHLVEAVLSPAIHCMRDPTRGGLATVLNELAGQSAVAMRIFEQAIPVRDGVRAGCELLGYDPLYLANEGKLVALVAPETAEFIVERMRRHALGRQAAIIGEVLAGPAGRVAMVTAIGGSRIVGTLSGEMLPRIC